MNTTVNISFNKNTAEVRWKSPQDKTYGMNFSNVATGEDFKKMSWDKGVKKKIKRVMVDSMTLIKTVLETQGEKKLRDYKDYYSLTNNLELPRSKEYIDNKGLIEKDITFKFV